MLAALAAADLVVGRAGSSTLAEVTALGLPMVVVPYPHAAGHQRRTRACLADAGAAGWSTDEDFDADGAPRGSRAARRPGGAPRDAAAARALGRPGAADAVAELVWPPRRAEPFPDPAVDRAASRGRAA